MSKNLGDFLQEQQEPFILEVYLLERGYSSSNVGTCLKRSVSSGLKRNKKFIPNCSKIVRALFTRHLSATDSQKINNNSGIRDKNVSVSEKESSRQADDDKFSSASSATVFNSCSESDGEEAHYSSRKDDRLATAHYYKHILAEIEVGEDQRFTGESAKYCKQIGPFSDDHSQACKRHDNGRRIQKHFSTSVAYKSEKPFCSTSIGEFGKPDASSQYSINKKTVQQTGQLLFDCVREVVEKHKRDSSGQQIPQILGPEKLWELICKNIWLWSKESINETNTNHLLHLDMLASDQEWGSFEQQMHEIDMQIADAILEDISNEIITDMIIKHGFVDVK
ncbi:hypothetical protein ACH5RR_034881 [Cinchona calisaya]|uniref:DUF4378 domain-containing protein n=1 Tax=Cinchona calisaya TaxID=153742 RepID=A0ABD2YCP8_9GENT